MAEQKTTPADRMWLATNPEYDPGLEPHENEFAYVNPVRLNNDLIRIANEMLTLAEASGNAQKAITRLKLDRHKLEQEQDDLEEELLRDDPLAPSEAKSLKTIAAAVARRAQQTGMLVKLLDRRTKIRALTAEIEKQEGIVRISKMYWDTAERVSENIKTHLSYVKADREASRHGT